MRPVAAKPNRPIVCWTNQPASQNRILRSAINSFVYLSYTSKRNLFYSMWCRTWNAGRSTRKLKQNIQDPVQEVGRSLAYHLLSSWERVNEFARKGLNGKRENWKSTRSFVYRQPKMGRQSVELLKSRIANHELGRFCENLYCSGLSEQRNYEVLIVCSCNVSIKDWKIIQKLKYFSFYNILFENMILSKAGCMILIILQNLPSFPPVTEYNNKTHKRSSRAVFTRITNIPLYYKCTLRVSLCSFTLIRKTYFTSKPSQQLSVS